MNVRRASRIARLPKCSSEGSTATGIRADRPVALPNLGVDWPGGRSRELKITQLTGANCSAATVRFGRIGSDHELGGAMEHLPDPRLVRTKRQDTAYSRPAVVCTSAGRMPFRTWSVHERSEAHVESATPEGRAESTKCIVSELN